ELEFILRHACLDGARECIAASALNPATLRPLLERAGAILARDLTHEDKRPKLRGEDETDAATSDEPETSETEMDAESAEETVAH
ncbi:MAG: hypothetical protein H7Z38_22545, partial [Rubrivivax sp.]|nr:hypothetical protein [Pyrinomonadaceae bacterium]